jgi:hypothetical protein
MDHRCLYGHRVPATFSFAIQNRTCPTCGAGTLTLNGYEAARALAGDGGLDAMAAFAAVRLLEASWRLVPVDAVDAAPAEAPSAALGAPEEEPRAAAPAAGPAVDELEVVEVQPVAPVQTTGNVKPVVRSAGARERAARGGAYDAGDEAFFKGT